jgi:protein SCO1/2
MKMVAGKDFRLLAISMNHNESWDVASKKKKNYLDTYGVDGAEDGWSFLVGTETNVKKITNQLGFQFRWDEKTKQYAHPAVAYIMTPRGKISRYLYGIEFSPKTLRLSLVEAAEAKIGDVVDKLLLYCFKFNPEKSVYTIYSYNIMRIAGGFTVIIVALFIFPIWFRERKKKNKV